MFEPHSILWHYLWAAPNILLAILAYVMWKRGLHRQFRSFFLYACFQFVQWCVLYPADLIPSVPDQYFWLLYSLSSIVGSVITFILVSDIFADVFSSYSALAHFGRLLIRWAGGVLVIVATAIAAYAPKENRFWIITTSHIMQEAMFVVVSGLILLLFASSAYFKLTWNHRTFGTALGLGISACVHLATWAAMANAGLPDSMRNILDFVNLGTTHISVLIWYYYLLVPERAVTKSAVLLPENNLAVWNRELERLLQQ